MASSARRSSLNVLSALKRSGSISNSADKIRMMGGAKENLKELKEMKCLLEGWLAKRGGTNSALKKRYCRLLRGEHSQKAHLQYFRSESAAEDPNGKAAGTIVISGLTQILLDPKKEKYFHIAPLGAKASDAKGKTARRFIFKVHIVSLSRHFT